MPRVKKPENRPIERMPCSSKPDGPLCLRCRYGRGYQGVRGVSCRFPLSKKIDQRRDELDTLALVLHGGEPPLEMEMITAKGTEEGVKAGRITHPFYFDPAVLVSCDRFKELAKPLKMEAAWNRKSLLVRFLN